MLPIHIAASTFSSHDNSLSSSAVAILDLLIQECPSRAFKSWTIVGAKVQETLLGVTPHSTAYDVDYEKDKSQQIMAAVHVWCIRRATVRETQIRCFGWVLNSTCTTNFPTRRRLSRIFRKLILAFIIHVSCVQYLAMKTNSDVSSARTVL